MDTLKLLVETIDNLFTSLATYLVVIGFSLLAAFRLSCVYPGHIAFIGLVTLASLSTLIACFALSVGVKSYMTLRNSTSIVNMVAIGIILLITATLCVLLYLIPFDQFKAAGLVCENLF